MCTIPGFDLLPRTLARTFFFESATIDHGVHFVQGDALLFWGYHPLEEHPLGRMDWASEHTGCKVEAGRKWIATVWFRGSTWRARPNYPQLPQQ